MITVACLWVRGSRPYGVEYVAKLKAMVDRHLSVEHEFVCLTDRPKQLPAGVRAIPVKTVPGQRAWWLKVNLFNPAMPFEGKRILYLDLDVLIVGSLDPIALHEAPFVIGPDQNPRWVAKGGLKVVKGFNSSVMSWKRGKRSEVFTKWSPAVAKRLHGDQDHIKEVLPDATVLPQEWFRRISWGPPPWPAETKVVVCIKPKNHVAAEWWPWFAEMWG